MTITHAHKLLGQDLAIAPEALLSQSTDLQQALVSLVGAVDVAIIDGSTIFSSHWHRATRKNDTSPVKQERHFVSSVRAEVENIVAAPAQQIHLVIVFESVSSPDPESFDPGLYRELRDVEEIDSLISESTLRSGWGETKPLLRAESNNV
ncbi:BQ2448_146 [Microbotryum intermedium]|uniref:BQ2448_146 protein n=1 Tax=Microbotryum intermedium TaxID=269621 RepID=A0A238F4S7_9BASI|nr:BQ2448_146 [Microbotryum intermedium]